MAYEAGELRSMAQLSMQIECVPSSQSSETRGSATTHPQSYGIPSLSFIYDGTESVCCP